MSASRRRAGVAVPSGSVTAFGKTVSAVGAVLIAVVATSSA